ncbi:MAG: MG2 domain-containing protein [Anaerolineales bacterium]
MQGTANVAFHVPEDLAPEQTLIVRTRSRLGSDTLEQAVTVERDWRVLLTTDKPIYQPGQTIHLRALALSAFDLTPAAGQALEVTIADGAGNKVFRQTLDTSEYGVAAVDFQLASEVSSGNYKISAELAGVTSEKTVTVEHYTLPKYDIQFEMGKAYYQPGERVHGSLHINYFFGKPVDEAEVLLEGYVFDVERLTRVTLQGSTSEDGVFDFEFDLPDYIAGSDLEGGLGRFYLQASVTDQAQHTEIKNTSLPVSGSAIVIEAIPEGGRFRPGIENILYVLTSYPDGSPAETDLSITFYDSGQGVQATTGEYGITEVSYTPQYAGSGLFIEAQDAQGSQASREFYFEGESSGESVLLRPEKPVYRVGESMRLQVFTSQPSGSVYLDIVREGQTVSTRSLDLQNGEAEAVIDLTPDLYGTLELHAYKILTSGSIVRDTRLVVVDQAAALDISMDFDQQIYRPGDTALLNVNVNGEDGVGVQSALGLAVVDEAVFALAEQDPGFAKLYFLLEQEILTPRYELHGFSVPDLVSGIPISSEQTVLAVEDAAQASLAAALPGTQQFSLEANSRLANIEKAQERQVQFFHRLSIGLYALFLALCAGIVVLCIRMLTREKVFGRSLLLAFGLLVGLLVFLLVLGLLLPLLGYYSYGGILERMFSVFDFLSYRGEALLVLLALSALLGLVLLFVHAIHKKDAALGWMTGLLVLLIGTLVGLILAAEEGRVSPEAAILIPMLVAFLLVALAFLVGFSGLALQRRILGALGAAPLALFLLLGGLPLLFVGMNASTAARGLNGAMMVEDAVMEAAPAMGMDMQFAKPEEEAAMDETANVASASTTEGPRLRQYFPETMFWLPDAVTGVDGSLSLELPVADSITTWRLTALASSQDGRLGSASGSLRVFQDFFIDLDLPLSLTVGDEIAVPVGVFNYLEEPQTVRLELQQEDWFELLDEPVKTIDIAASDISVVYFRVRALDFGTQPFQVTALGSSMSDAIRREVHVYPDGKQVFFTQSDRLTPGEDVQAGVMIPAEAIPGTQTLAVKVYPGVMSQIVEGLDALLRMPFGCFEQTSSTTYPNILVMDYLKTAGLISPEVQMTAEEYINLGYQRLVTFEVGSSGGFSLFGDAPADPMLTAYGLQEFNDMSRVHPVDPAILERIAAWLAGHQNGDGSWEGVQGFHESGLTGMTERLPVTAYVVWGLADAGYAGENAAQQGAAYLREHASQAEDAYTLALVANALSAYDLAREDALSQAAKTVLERLAGMAKTEGGSAYWESGGKTVMGSYGETGALETTALAALALLRSNTHPDLANAALNYLVQSKDSFGTWETTQATVMALKAFLQSVRGGAENVNAEVTVTLNNGQTRTAQLTPENFDVVQYLRFDDINIGRENQVAITASGEGGLMYQVSGSYYLPWDAVAQYPELVGPEELVSIDVAYDRTELAVNDTLEVTVTVSLNELGGVADSAIVDLGLPPGFSVQAEDLSALVAYYNDTPEDYPYATIQRYELTGRQIIVYISNLGSETPLTFKYHLLAKFPLRVQTPASSAYDYYNPGVAGEQPPQTLVVSE